VTELQCECRVSHNEEEIPVVTTVLYSAKMTFSSNSVWAVIRGGATGCIVHSSPWFAAAESELGAGSVPVSFRAHPFSSPKWEAGSPEHYH
jgi:hypothetical protein